MSDKQTPKIYKSFEEFKQARVGSQKMGFSDDKLYVDHVKAQFREASIAWHAAIESRDAEINELKEEIKKKNNSIRFELDALGGYLLSINAPVSAMKEFSKTRKLVESILNGDKDD